MKDKTDGFIITCIVLFCIFAIYKGSPDAQAHERSLSEAEICKKNRQELVDYAFERLSARYVDRRDKALYFETIIHSTEIRCDKVCN